MDTIKLLFVKEEDLIDMRSAQWLLDNALPPYLFTHDGSPLNRRHVAEAFAETIRRSAVYPYNCKYIFQKHARLFITPTFYNGLMANTPDNAHEAIDTTIAESITDAMELLKSRGVELSVVELNTDKIGRERPWVRKLMDSNAFSKFMRAEICPPQAVWPEEPYTQLVLFMRQDELPNTFTTDWVKSNLLHITRPENEEDNTIASKVTDLLNEAYRFSPKETLRMKHVAREIFYQPFIEKLIEYATAKETDMEQLVFTYRLIDHIALSTMVRITRLLARQGITFTCLIMDIGTPSFQLPLESERHDDIIHYLSTHNALTTIPFIRRDI